jgi:hypothetical protein
MAAFGPALVTTAGPTDTVVNDGPSCPREPAGRFCPDSDLDNVVFTSVSGDLVSDRSTADGHDARVEFRRQLKGLAQATSVVVRETGEVLRLERE